LFDGICIALINVLNNSLFKLPVLQRLGLADRELAADVAALDSGRS